MCIRDRLEIVLDWAENGEADLVGYRVYRSTEENFPFEERINLRVVPTS